MTEQIATPTSQRHTIAEYLAFEEAATDRHEYHDGEILAMSGASFEHVQVTTNLIGTLRDKLRGTPCQALESNMRLRVQARNRYVYPDVSVICGPPEFDRHAPRPINLLNPRVLFEVLSASTERYDRGDKFHAYQTIPSLEEYVLVAQDQPRVETIRREADGAWRIEAFAGLAAVVRVASLGVELPLAEIYLNVAFPPPAPPSI